jgi:hypothetical protein
MGPSSTVPTHFRPSRREEGRHTWSSLASLVTTVLLVLILGAAPCVLGAARYWYELPLLEGIALLLLFQAVRLLAPALSARRIDAIDFAVIAFTLYALARWLTSPAEYYSRLEALSVVGYAVLFLTCRHGIVRRTHALALIVLLVVLGLGETAFGYYLSQHSDISHPESLWFPFGPTERLQLHYAPRWLGTYGSPNHYAELLVMATGSILALACFSKWPWPLRIVLFYLSVMVLVAILYAQSRGAWVALFGAVLSLTFFALRYSAVRWWVVAGAAAIFLAALGTVFAESSIVQARMVEVHEVLDSSEPSGYQRIQLDKDALRIAHDHFLLGTGPATFVFIHPRYQNSTFPFAAQLTHDDYLNCLDDYGIVGFGIAMFFVFAVTLSLMSRVRADFRWADRVVVAAAFAAWCALLIHSAVDFNLHIPANAMILFALAGVGLRRPEGAEAAPYWSTVSLASLGRWPALVLLVFGLVDGAEVARTALGDIAYEGTQAKVEDVPSDQSIAGLQAALADDPGNVDALLLLGDIYRVQAVGQKDFADRYATAQQALSFYQRALKANPLDDTIRGRMGLTFDIMRRYSEAFLCYQAAVTAQPYDGQFWSALGNHFWQRGLLRKADEAYRIAAGCPHGSEGAAASAREVEAILTQEGTVPPAPGTNPLLPETTPPESQTIP